MTDIVDTLSSKDRQAFRTVHSVLTKAGYDVRLVGGSVRDLLRGVPPKDLDFATTAPPEEVVRLFSNEFAGYQAIPTGIKHGTVTVVLRGRPVEVTTLRRDVSTDGRHAEVEFTDDWELDACRRDFTVNAMYLELDGTLHDYFGGQEDLAAGRIAFVGGPRHRIREDYLRIMRYFRFQSTICDRLEFDPGTLIRIGEESHNLALISGERIWSELLKTMAGRHVEIVSYWMSVEGVFKSIDGLRYDLSAAGGLHCYLQHWRTFDPGRPPSGLRVLARFVPDLDAVERLRERLKFDNNSHRILTYLVKNRDSFVDFRDVKSMVARGEDPELLRHLCLYQCNLEALREVESLEVKSVPKFPVNGKDVVDSGVPAGREVGRVLKALKEVWIESGFTVDRETLLSKVGEV